MSTNCIHCGTNDRSGPDLLCDDCRDKCRHAIIVLNGKARNVAVRNLSYEDIVKMAGHEGQQITVTYRYHYADRSRRMGGSLTAGEIIAVEDGMVFNAMDTSAA